MKKTILIGLILVLSGCHTLTGALIGGGIGGVIGGGRGAAVGAAIGAGIGGEADILEQKAAYKNAGAREPKVIDLGNGKKAVIIYGRTGQVKTSPYTYGRSSYDYGYGAPDCSMFPTPNEQAECERGKRYTEDKLRRERERRAYEYGQYGY